VKAEIVLGLFWLLAVFVGLYFFLGWAA